MTDQEVFVLWIGVECLVILAVFYILFVWED